MEIVKIYVGNSPLFKKLVGRFQHVHVTGGRAYLIGGVCRALMAGAPIHDFDFTVIAEGDIERCYYTLDRSPKGDDRIEVEHDAPHASLADYFRTRDFRVNQVALDSKGYLWLTQRGAEDWRKRRLVSVSSRISLREGARAVRFANELQLTCSPSISNFIQKYEEEIRRESVFRRYVRQGLVDPETAFEPFRT